MWPMCKQHNRSLISRFLRATVSDWALADKMTRDHVHYPPPTLDEAKV